MGMDVDTISQVNCPECGNIVPEGRYCIFCRADITNATRIVAEEEEKEEIKEEMSLEEKVKLLEKEIDKLRKDIDLLKRAVGLI